MKNKHLIQKAIASTERVQGFDPLELVQRDRLESMNFREAVEPARRFIEVFKHFTPTFLEQLPDRELEKISQYAEDVQERFNTILAFNLDRREARRHRTQLISGLEECYQDVFSQLHSLIAFSMVNSEEYIQWNARAQADFQNFSEKMNDLTRGATAITDKVRRASAERGVSQQASYFKEEADKHGAECSRWGSYTIWMAIVVGFYGLLTLTLHKVPFLAPTDLYETIQLAVGKLIVFFVLVYMLFLCAKNLLSNRHNEIVNRHRQNALMTYEALVDAGGTPEARDVVLAHAASSIYSPNETGYARLGDGGSASGRSVVELIPRTSVPLNMGGGG